MKLLSLSSIVPAKNATEYVCNRIRYIVYVDGNLYMFFPDELYNQVSLTFYNRNEYLPLSADELLKVLNKKVFRICQNSICFQPY